MGGEVVVLLIVVMIGAFLLNAQLVKEKDDEKEEIMEKLAEAQYVAETNKVRTVPAMTEYFGPNCEESGGGGIRIPTGVFETKTTGSECEYSNYTPQMADNECLTLYGKDWVFSTFVGCDADTGVLDFLGDVTNLLTMNASKIRTGHARITCIKGTNIEGFLPLFRPTKPGCHLYAPFKCSESAINPDHPMNQKKEVWVEIPGMKSKTACRDIARKTERMCDWGTGVLDGNETMLYWYNKGEDISYRCFDEVNADHFFPREETFAHTFASPVF